MKLVKVNKVPVKRNGSFCKNQMLINEFLESGLECCRVEYAESEYVNQYSCCYALKKSADRMGKSNSVDVFCADKKVYMKRIL